MISSSCRRKALMRRLLSVTAAPSILLGCNPGHIQRGRTIHELLQEPNYVQSRTDTLIALVNIYKARGGGWMAEAEQLTVPPKSPDKTIVKQVR